MGKKAFQRALNELADFYESKQYWKVTALWFNEENQSWSTSEHFSVSEGGEVVRFLGGI